MRCPGILITRSFILGTRYMPSPPQDFTQRDLNLNPVSLFNEKGNGTNGTSSSTAGSITVGRKKMCIPCFIDISGPCFNLFLLFLIPYSAAFEKALLYFPRLDVMNSYISMFLST